MPDDTATSWFVPFAAACAVAGALALALVALAYVRARDARRASQSANRAAALLSHQEAALREQHAIVEAAPFGIVAIDRMGRVLTMNPAAHAMLGLARARSTAALLMELVRSPELPPLIASALESGRAAEAELTFQSGGTRRIARAVAAPLGGSASGRASGSASGRASDAACVVVLHDLTELRRLESVRSEFVANVSHELRTPVTNLRGYSETLLSSFEFEPQVRSFIETIQRNAARLGAIIDDLLLLASLEGERADPLERSPVPVRAVLADAIERHAEVAATKRITIELRGPAGLAVEGNAGLLGHAVGNLVENAVKYSPAESNVVVEAMQDDDHVVIEVRDQGPGIPQQHLDRIFERFYRVDRARSRESGGTGIGLSIVKHVASMHGGIVTAESRIGAGSCFRLRIPFSHTEGPPRLNAI